MAADIVIFDPDTVRPMPESVVHDFPAGGWRVKEPAAGIMATIVNGEVLMENGKHTGALPGRVLRNTTITPITPSLALAACETARSASCGRSPLRCRSPYLPLWISSCRTSGALQETSAPGKSRGGHGRFCQRQDRLPCPRDDRAFFETRDLSSRSHLTKGGASGRPPFFGRGVFSLPCFDRENREEKSNHR
jgi:hypothetical protein